MHTMVGETPRPSASYYIGPPPLSSWSYRRAWAFILAGLSQWVSEFLGACGKAYPLENDNDNLAANVWEFQLLHGPATHVAPGVTAGRGHLFGRTFRNWVMN